MQAVTIIQSILNFHLTNDLALIPIYRAASIRTDPRRKLQFFVGVLKFEPSPFIFFKVADSPTFLDFAEDGTMTAPSA